MNNLILGDCVQHLKTLQENSVDLTVTSPPYDNLRTYNGNIAQWGEHVWKEVIAEIYRVTKEGGVVVWVVGDATIEGSETGTSFKQALWAKECGFNLETMIWEKPTFTATGSLSVRYAPVFEYMFVFSKGKATTFNPIKDKVNKSYGNKKHGTVRQPNGTTRPQSSLGKEIGRYGQRHNVWHISQEMSNAKRVHPALFPEKLAHDHIISWSNEGDTVLDPFMGSGTTGKIAKQLGRNFIGIELDETYYNIAKQRIENTP